MAHRGPGMYGRRQYWYFKYKTADGQWIEHATRTKHSQEAQKIRTAFLREAEAGQLPNDRANWTLKDAITRWLADRKLRVSTGTYASDGTTTRALARVLFASPIASPLRCPTCAWIT